MMINTFVIGALTRYVDGHILPGGFLEAVLSNDLREACRRADGENRYVLFYIVTYCNNNLPSECWGSPDKVSAWLNMIHQEQE